MKGEWDVVVVGAGPAGAVAARELARRGRSVLLLDKATFPRAKVCGCCLNANALAALAAVGLCALPAALGATPLTHVRLSAGGREAPVRLPGGVALSRTALDGALVEAAQAAGAEFRANAPAVLGDLAGDRREVRLGGAAVRAHSVIVAHGLVGGVAESGSRIGAGCVLADAPAFYRPGVVHMAAGVGGYVGLVRLEDGRLDVAAALDPTFVRTCGGLPGAAARLLAETGWPPLAELLAAAWKGTPALTRRPARLAGERWFAVGDAAGYVEPFTGEGMAWAVASAAAVAPFAAADWRPDFPRRWHAEHARVVGRRQRVCRWVAAALRQPAVCRWTVRTLAALPGLAAPLVRRLNAPTSLGSAPR